MNDIIKVDFENETISARDLYESISSGKERFSKWFSRQLQYGFVEGEDYSNPYQKVRVGIEGDRNIEREVEDYDLSIDMAKHICMVQKTEKSKQIRQYLIDLEKVWNSPEQVMARALRLADRTIQNLKLQIEEQKPLVDFANQISDTTDLIDMKTMAKLLKDKNINIGRNRLFEFLRNKKILMRDNQPYQQYVDAGYFKVNEYTFTNRFGQAKTNRQTFVTGRGQLYIAKKVKEYLG